MVFFLLSSAGGTGSSSLHSRTHQWRIFFPFFFYFFPFMWRLSAAFLLVKQSITSLFVWVWQVCFSKRVTGLFSVSSFFLGFKTRLFKFSHWKQKEKRNWQKEIGQRLYSVTHGLVFFFFLFGTKLQVHKMDQSRGSESSRSHVSLTWAVFVFILFCCLFFWSVFIPVDWRFSLWFSLKTSESLLVFVNFAATSLPLALFFFPFLFFSVSWPSKRLHLPKWCPWS